MELQGTKPMRGKLSPVLLTHFDVDLQEDGMIAGVWRRFAPPNKPFLFALKGAPVQGNMG